MFNPIRGTDAWGSGHFGASRGSRPHLGIDIITVPNEPIYAPVDMYIERVSYPYIDSTSLKGIAFNTQVNGVNYDGRLWYFVPDASLIGRDVNKGQFIGYAQGLQERYSAITDHVHLQLRTKSSVDNSMDSIEYNGWTYINPSTVI